MHLAILLRFTLLNHTIYLCACRFSFLLEACIDVGRSVLFTGVTGVGKSVIAVDAFESMRERKHVVPYTINFSAQTQVGSGSASASAFLQLCLSW